MGTQLYRKVGSNPEPCYPNTTADSINTSQVNGAGPTLLEDLTKIYKLLATLTGEEEATSSIRVIISYLISDSKNKNTVANEENWNSNYISPTIEKPYLWKRTIFTYAGDTQLLNKNYEICETHPSLAVKSQTLYFTTNTEINSLLEVKYPQKNGKDNYQATLDEIIAANKDKSGNYTWLANPQSISAATPNCFMVTRGRTDLDWDKFGSPVQYGKWTVTSVPEFKFATTPIDSSTTPSCNTAANDPGSNWKSANTETGVKVWMIIASKMNNLYNVVNGTIWTNPILISVIS